MATPQMKLGMRKLSDLARTVSAPTGITATGWPAVLATCERKLGITFDDWQHGAGRLILSKRSSGKLASMIDGVGISIPRQVGKTYLIGAMVFALCINQPGLLVIWSAHHNRTHAETFLSMQGFAERTKVSPYIRQIYLGSGDEEVRFLNGSRILFGARERGFGRGIPGVDVLMFDEAQILSDRALANMLATMNTSRFGLHLYVGTPPRPEDVSDVFHRFRSAAASGGLTDGAWIEFGADPRADPDDRKQWSKANPSYPRRTPVESILRMRSKLTAEDFLREGMGVWDAAVSNGVIPMAFWEQRGDELSIPVDRFALGIEVGPDLTAASVSLAGQRLDGLWHIELDKDGKGADWLAPYVQRLVSDNPEIRAVVCDVGGPMAALVEQRSHAWYLKGTKVVVTPMTVKELGAGCALMLNGIVTGDVIHTAQPQLTAAAKVATKRTIRDSGMWVFHRASSAADITPIQSATYALVGAQNLNVKRPDRSTDNRRVVVL